MQDKGFVTPWHLVGLAVAATSGAVTAEARTHTTHDVSVAPLPPLPDAQKKHPAKSESKHSLKAEPFDYRSPRTTDIAEIGRASYYAGRFQGRPTASGEPYDMYAFTAAHRKLPLGTFVRVSNLTRTRSVIVRINDRGPYVKGRSIDLSYAAASKLGLLRAGSEDVILEPVSRHVAQEADHHVGGHHVERAASAKHPVERAANAKHQVERTASAKHPKRVMLHIAHHPRGHVKHAHVKTGHPRGRIQFAGARSSRA
ncbi:septal ring lytic transglycosylase RlpA family protein [Caballeronia insecticola]|uniref:Endolytic peptidoglycan transglycosylase RlpA n=1 Tax=Caballeronia insecticola TaxID=758793 RepID=R4WTQ1_9BURK|nr:septal ring lytic transglycosylase RlpA family protein [Caballeronia insecticola]BAN28003.1 rare lipoprotein A [Caballeronia insecticola]